MKTISNLDIMLRPLTQRDVVSKQVPTLRDVLVESVGRRKPENVRRSVAFFKLTEKILEANGELKLEDIEWDTLKESVEENPSGYFPFYHGQVLELLKLND